MGRGWGWSWTLNSQEREVEVKQEVEKRQEGETQLDKMIKGIALQPPTPQGLSSSRLGLFHGPEASEVDREHHSRQTAPDDSVQQRGRDGRAGGAALRMHVVCDLCVCV